MRVWLNPEKVAERGLTADEVVAAIRSQNVQASAGVIGGPPYKTGVELQIPDQRRGPAPRTREQFGEMIIKRNATASSPGSRMSRASRSTRPNTACARSSTTTTPSRCPIFQLPGANAIHISDQVRATMAELKKEFPEGVDYSIAYDPTVFVRDSIKAVLHTLLEALALVVLVVILFLQTWRASVIPLLAVPVSIVGTLAVMHLVHGSINALSLFGLVLAIGIVVDDAIVVVENVERNIHDGLSPHDATIKAMSEVTSPIIAITLVLCAVFVPIAFISGLTGQFYRQFALTIAFSTVISAFNSLTLSPALAAILLQGQAREEGRSHAPHRANFRARSSAASTGSSSASSDGLRPGRRRHRGPQGRSPCAFMRRLIGAHLLRVPESAARFRAGAGQGVPRLLRAVARRRQPRAHREGHPPDDRHRPQGARRAQLGRVPRAVDQRLHQQPQRGHRLPRAQAVRGAPKRRPDAAPPSRTSSRRNSTA